MTPRKRDKNVAGEAVAKEPASRGGNFPIVGMGASAGGLEAFEQFFRAMPPDSGMAFVLVSHLDPGHVSMLTDILQRVTGMPVVEAQDQMAVEPNHVYAIPPNRELTVFHGKIQLGVPEAARGQRMPIDTFLRSLAEDEGERAIGVILSGTGTDGTLGLRAIHGAGGAALVQEPATAKYDGMPSSAVNSGVATYVLPVEKMPEQLLAYVKTIVRPVGTVVRAPAEENAFGKVVQLLRSRTGHDFSLYKKSTVGRRVERRMAAHSIGDVSAYASYLQDHPDEVQLLFKELLINVTSFFRDAEAFEALKKEILPPLFAGKPDGYIFRVWVAGCATGEEAYSIAILFREHMEEVKREFKVQVYATDIDDDAIAEARSGSYPPNIAIDVSPERLRRFFVKQETGYRVKKDVREMIVFATQNVIKDPPFTRLDLVSFRNVLIYLEPELQERLIAAFHYALKPQGVLFLSPSESIGNHTDLFMPLNRRQKFYQAKTSASSARLARAGALSWPLGQPGRVPDETARKVPGGNVAEVARKMLLESFAPPAVVTDKDGGILYVHGDTGRYLRPAPGQASLNVIEMAREGLQLDLRTAILSAAARRKPVICRNLRVKTNGGFHDVDLCVKPLAEVEGAEACLIISFQEPAPAPREKAAKGKRPAAAKDVRHVAELEQSLRNTRETLEANIEELQASNEELKSTNEELQSTNEELQSTNEEMETSKEELQSVNEELVTVNAEMQAKNDQLNGMQSDLRNLLDNTEAGTIFLDGQLAIKRFTRQAAAVYRLVASDVGRPLGDIKSNFEGEDLLAEARAALDTLTPREKQVRTAGQGDYRVRILPYRTIDNVIDGVVLTFTDVTALIKAEAASEMAREYAESIVDTVREPLVVLGADLTVRSASRSFYGLFGVTKQATVGQPLYELGGGQWDVPGLRKLLETILQRDTSFEELVVEDEFPGLGRRKMLLNARRILGKADQLPLILLAMEDVTGENRPEAGAPEKGARTDGQAE